MVDEGKGREEATGRVGLSRQKAVFNGRHSAVGARADWDQQRPKHQSQLEQVSRPSEWRSEPRAQAEMEVYMFGLDGGPGQGEQEAERVRARDAVPTWEAAVAASQAHDRERETQSTPWVPMTGRPSPLRSSPHGLARVGELGRVGSVCSVPPLSL